MRSPYKITADWGQERGHHQFCVIPRRLLQAFLGISLLSLFSGCEAPVDWTFHPGENGELAVEAIITNEVRRQEIRLSRTYDDLNGDPSPVVGASVQVSGAGETYTFTESSSLPGVYISTEAFAAQLFTPYTLQIQWEGQTYEAQNSMVQVVPFQPLTFLPVGNTDSLRTIGSEPSLFSPHEQAMYEVDIDWRHLVGSDSARARVYYYTFNTIDVSELFRPPKETVYFPKGSVVTISKFSLDPEFAAFCRALVMETEWQGGVFDEASSSLPTNISNGGHGFFGVSAVLRDTVFVY
ncbi:MAG: DUF4249 family protein [Lewinellaceae bacterium]|nr:DUF4249 family protein [Lewinellaceae bacterium]